MTLYTQRPRPVYFIRPIGESGPVKIGCSMRPERRRIELQCIVGKRLELVAQFMGCMDDERRIHSAFWGDHVRGEWFNWSPALQAIIDQVAEGGFDISTLPETKVRPMPHRRRGARQFTARTPDRAGLGVSHAASSPTFTGEP